MVTTSVENLAHHDNKTMKSGYTCIYKQKSSSCRQGNTLLSLFPPYLKISQTIQTDHKLTITKTSNYKEK